MVPEAPRALLLHPDDNVLVCVQTLCQGEKVQVDDKDIELRDDIAVGHKLARRDIAAGEKVLRYGAPIGSATQAIPRGAHVHVHNLKSDHIASHDRTVTHER
jgi:altronate dehydratase